MTLWEQGEAYSVQSLPVGLGGREEECHQEAEKLKAADEDWSQYRYIPRKQLTIQAKLPEESGKPREEHPAAGASEPAPRKRVRLLRKSAVKDAACDSPSPALSVEARCAAGELTDADFYPTVGNEMATRVAATAQRGKRRRENGELVAIQREMIKTEAEERWAKQDAL